ncbi:hypothetical protein PoB_004655900 [Plakobranchus ocellatus]|uniref:Uncharacterized protein n=1 Tax=Plakobranchus ocellatus TaxID=259542 RepID=A0AAV4BP22_9GAST|nr:hypothetical protein PoB_004655900 [Plakobranchus ocellatus]
MAGLRPATEVSLQTSERSTGHCAIDAPTDVRTLHRNRRTAVTPHQYLALKQRPACKYRAASSLLHAHQ